MLEKIKSVLLGVAIGDALGVPVEFSDHNEIKKNPVAGMTGYGTYNLPSGTFSDDSSMTFCLAEALAKSSDIDTILKETAKNFIKWMDAAYWTARGSVFDIGRTTLLSISRLKQGGSPELAGGANAEDNGNGSLMRIAPLVFYLLDKPVAERFEITARISAITHGHIRSIIACFYYLEFAKQIIEGKDKREIYRNLQRSVPEYLASISTGPSEIAHFDRLLKQDITEADPASIWSGGYVIQTIEASIWCLMTTGNYNDAVLRAVNLGHDTDTTAAVTGGLAGLLYGMENIPAAYKETIARHDDIVDLAERMYKRFWSNHD
ncbi:MAG: ADP-ribosylglycohydrolase family protein [Treponema sp.]|nr:ADP-ribosylglycohydrolase family protein [Treponema sp.]